MNNRIAERLRSKGMNEEAMYIMSLEQMNNELKKQRDRYKEIIDDIRNIGSLRPKTIEDIRDLT
jgi:surfactin synthase thioesterase subunit